MRWKKLMKLKKLMEKDCFEWKLTAVHPQERNTWRSGVRSAMPAASQLPHMDNEHVSAS